MKTYLEIADDVFQKGEACLKQKKERSKKIKETAAFAAIAAVILFSAFGITKGLLPQKVPVILPGSSNAPQTATTAQSGETISTTAAANTQNSVPGTQKTGPKESGTKATRAAGGADVTTKPTAYAPGSDEPTTAVPDESGRTEPVNEPEPVSEPGGDERVTTDSGEGSTQAPDDETEPTAELPKDDETEPAEEPAEQTYPAIRSIGSNPKKLSPAVVSPGTQTILKAAMEDNAFGWIKYRDQYYVQDNVVDSDELDLGERIGTSADFEGNLELLGLSGDLYLLKEAGDPYLLLKTPDGQDLIFLPYAVTE